MFWIMQPWLHVLLALRKAATGRHQIMTGGSMLKVSSAYAAVLLPSTQGINTGAVQANIADVVAHRQAPQQYAEAHELEVLEDPNNSEKAQQAQQADHVEVAAAVGRPRAVPTQ